MPHDAGALWRKKRRGREYGSFHTYAGGRIVNLGTSVLDQARAAAAKLAGAPSVSASPVTPGNAGPPPDGAPTSRSQRPRPLAAWAAGVGPAGGPTPGPALAGPPEPPKVELTAAMKGLAEGMAGAVARINAVSLSLACKYLAHVQPGKPDPDEIEALERTWASGLKELMLLHGLQWWHILLAQNGALVLSMIQTGAPLPPATNAPVVQKVNLGVVQNQ